VHASAVQHDRVAPNTRTTSTVATLVAFECDHDVPLVAIPRPELQLVVRFGPSVRRGVDVYALGARQRVHRKLIGRGHRTVTARLHLGTTEAVLGVSASAMAERIVALEDLWGDAATQQLLDRLAGARDTADAAAILESAIAERLAIAAGRRAHAQLALDAAARLACAHVRAVAADLGVSERHLRRVFRETIGVSPKTFARLARFHDALRAAGEAGAGQPGWAHIAAAAGYYDQAHLIAEFRAIAGVTPRALLRELRAGAYRAARSDGASTTG
jgi:AraC-like DNA-binding protein